MGAGVAQGGRGIIWLRGIDDAGGVKYYLALLLAHRVLDSGGGAASRGTPADGADGGVGATPRPQQLR